MTFYGYEVILNEIDRGRGHEHRCVYTAGSLISRTLEYVRCLSFVRICLTDLSGVWILCPNFVYLDSVRCPDSVRNFRKNAVRCLSVRPDKGETELSGLSLSLSADVWSKQ